MFEKLEEKLEYSLDYILHQLTKGISIEEQKRGKIYLELHQVKEWKSKYGYSFHIYSNDHFIDNKPHFHLINKSEKIDCRFFFHGEMIDCKEGSRIRKKVIEALEYFLELENNQKKLIELWNIKNPNFLIKNYNGICL